MREIVFAYKHCNAFFLFFFVVSAAPALWGQEAIVESRAAIVFRGKQLAIGATQQQALKAFGKAPLMGKKVLWTYSGGLKVAFSADKKVVAFQMAPPFRGKTQRGMALGAKVHVLKRFYPELKNVREGPNRIGGMELEVRSGKVYVIRLTGKGPAPLKTKPRPAARPKTKPELKPKLKPRPAPKPRPKAKDRKQEKRNQILIWDQPWRPQGPSGWLDLPTNGWPSDQGSLLLRIAYGQGSTSAEQLFNGYDRGSANAGDHELAANFLVKKRQGRRPLRWQFRFLGKGRSQGRVQVLWFRTSALLRQYLKRNPYQGSFTKRKKTRREEKLGDWRKKVRLVYDHTWRAQDGAHFRRGPKEDWPSHRGVLLLRTFAGPGVSSCSYRAGLGQAVQLHLGDHTLAVDILDRAKKQGGILGGLSGNDRKYLHFAAHGRGPFRVQLYWLPERAIVKTYCDEKPLAKINPWIGLAAAPLPWLFKGSDSWRQNDRYESDWRLAAFSELRGRVNVAARRQGALLRRSSRNPRLSQGSEWDGGLWYGAPSEHSWIESYFVAPAQIERIDLASAGSDGQAARFLLVELLGLDGRWQRVATFHRENLNWCRLSGDRQVISRAPVSIPVDAHEQYRAIRLVFSGHGPFRAAGLAVWGRFAAEPLFEELKARPSASGNLVISATSSWVNSRCDVAVGSSIIFELGGRWSVAAERDGSLGWCGGEGYSAVAARSFFANATAYDDFCRRLPAPQLPWGALLVRIGKDSPPRVVVPGDPMLFSNSGRLFFTINDIDRRDNRGELRCTVLGAAFWGAAEAVQVLKPRGPKVRCRGRILVAGTNRGISGTDIILQEEAWPRRIMGGIRSDADGRFDFEIEVGRGRALVLRIPEFKIECAAKSYTRDGTFEWSPQLR